MCVKVIASQMWDVFETRCISLKKSKIMPSYGWRLFENGVGCRVWGSPFPRVSLRLLISSVFVRRYYIFSMKAVASGHLSVCW